MSGSSTRPVSPGTTELSYNLPSYQTPAQHHQQQQHHLHHQGQPQYHQTSFGDLQDSVGKAQLGTVDQPPTSLEGLHVSVPHTTGSTRPNLSLDASLASSLTTNLSTILGSASSTWSTQPSLQYPSVQGYSHPGSISGTPESNSRPGSVGPHVAGHQQSHKMEGSPYESSWRNHYGQSTASNGYPGQERDQYAYGISQNAYNRVPAGYSSYSGATQPHHLMSMATSSNTNPSTHEVDIPREPYIPPSTVSNAHSSAAFQPRPAVTGYPPNAYNMAVAAHQLQASQHGHAYPGHVSNALLHSYSSSPIAISGLTGSHNASPAASPYNMSGMMNHQNQSPYAAAAAAVGHPIGSAFSSAGNTPGSSGTFTNMRDGLAGPIVARKTKYTRSRTGCLACRVKRVKCDETRPECKRCIGAKRKCVFPSLADLPKATIRALTAKKRKESGSDLDDSGLAGLNSGDVSTATSANASGDETDSVRSRILPPAPAYQASTYNPYSAATGPYAVANATYAPQAAAYNQMYGGDRSMHLQADWQNRLQAQDSHRSQQPSRTGTPGLSAVVAAQNSLHSPKREAGSDDGQAEIKAEHIQTAINGAVDESSRLYLSQQRHELLAMHQPTYYTASSTLPRLSSPNSWKEQRLMASLFLPPSCANAATLMMAIPSGLSGLNPILAVNLPLSLSAPRGKNKAVDALRLSLLGVGAIHQAFLFAKNQSALSQTSSLLSRARTLREAAKDMLIAASQDAEMAKHDAAIAAGATNALIDIFFGGTRWEDNFMLVKDLIHRRGGPAAMVSASSPRMIAEGGTAQTSRLLLETLSIYDVMSCLAVGKQPTLLADGGSEWWLRPNLATSEMHSVEKQFGMSRTMVYLLFRTAKLLADLKETGVILNEKGPQVIPVPHINDDDDDDDDDDDASSVQEEAIISLDMLEQISNLSSGKTAELWHTALTLLEDIERWIKVLKRERTEHERVHLGNLAYANAMKAGVKQDEVGKDDRRVEVRCELCCNKGQAFSSLEGLAIIVQGGPQ
ncbi:hypothetical protein QFC21_005149 [Naganishia friedmannii]|uniref:Uncharacterized protein n=1 Tax=Naganishia friedmannii TaxID=89922 RepID=A0ACC2VBG1_9TREE|nr:hypothetical protein QFC21_005149 [Naganishia friedmannii]